jgi:hypothetical protein
MIDKYIYLKICKHCDDLLNKYNSSIQRVSINWLHVIREHPIILNRYEILFLNNNLHKYIYRTKFVCINYLRFFFNIIGSIKKKPIFFELGHFEEDFSVDYLFVSHLIDASHLNNDFDFYFGNTIKNIDSLNYKTVTVLLNQTKITNEVLKKQYLLSSRKVLISKLLDFKNEISLFFQLFKESKIIKRELKKINHYNNELQSKIFKETSRQCLSSSTANNLRYHFQFKQIIKKYRPKNIISTFEGHAWERILFFAAKEQCISIQCIGYQHTSLFRFQHSVLRKLNPLFNPDVILTTGEAAYRRFKKSDIGFDKIVAILGSNRGNALIKSESLYETRNNTCIVIPEGFDSECFILFKFALECSKVSPEINFIFKLHPIMNKESFIKKYPQFNLLPSNVKWATDDIESDLSVCKWALYRGTTMIVQAIYAGLIPLYYQTNADEMSLDLLYEVSQMKPTLTNTNDFITNTLPMNQSIFDRNSVLNYCSTLYNNFNYKILIEVANLSN